MGKVEDGHATIDLRGLTASQREALFADALRKARYERSKAAEALVLRLWRRLRLRPRVGRTTRAWQCPLPS